MRIDAVKIISSIPALTSSEFIASLPVAAFSAQFLLLNGKVFSDLSVSSCGVSDRFPVSSVGFVTSGDVKPFETVPELSLVTTLSIKSS